MIDGATDWVRYSPDCWLLLTSDSPADWYRRLKPFVGESDELLVIPVKFDTWLGYLDQSVVSWIERHAKAKTAA